MSSDPSLLLIADAARLMCVVGACGLIGFAVAIGADAIRHARDGRRMVFGTKAAHRFACLTLGMSLLGSTALLLQAQRLSEPVSIYLPLQLAGVLLGLWGAAGLVWAKDRQ